MSLINLAKITAIKLGFKPIKSWIDDCFREKVVPVEGSVLYTDLYVIAEHSGIYIGRNEISNIVVDGFAEASVQTSSPDEFTNSSWLYSKIYVSCDKYGAVGDIGISRYAKESIGERGFYGLLFSNCHAFSEKCVYEADAVSSESNLFDIDFLDGTWEATIGSLKRAAKKQINAKKWRLWDWKNQEHTTPEPNLEEMIQQLQDTLLDENSSKDIKNNLMEIEEYLEEISDESIPGEAISKLTEYRDVIEEVNKKYEESKVFIGQMEHGFTYNELMNMRGVDFSLLAKELESNQEIQNIIEKLGRNYISEEKKETISKKLPSEVYSIHKSNELSRLLPIELSAIDDEDLEYLFYAKFLEKSLLTYELHGEEASFENLKIKGPVVACLDTSGSMNGMPLTKAKALLFAVSRILKKENRELYVLLFGANSQIKELHIKSHENSRKLLVFLSQGFNGGTDFETPLKRSFEIIESQNDFENADILMITDGVCSIGPNFNEKLLMKKQSLGFEVYTVICESSIVKDEYSTKIFNI